MTEHAPTLLDEVNATVRIAAILELQHEGNGFSGCKLVFRGLDARRESANGPIVITAHDGDKVIRFGLTDSDRDHLCAVLQSL